MKQYPPRSASQLAHARSTALGVLDEFSGVAAFLSGSPLAGLGTPTSDVDLFIVHDGAARTQQHFSGETRVDIEFIPRDKLTDLVLRCEKFVGHGDGSGQIQTASFDNLNLLIRFMLGEILVDHAGLSRLQERALGASDEIAKLLVARHAVQVANCAEDARGSLEIGDLVASQHVARSGLLSAAEAVLSAHGDPYLGTKWVWARWRRTLGDSLGAHVTEAVADPSLPPREALWLAQDLLLQAMTGITYPTSQTSEASDFTRLWHVMPILTPESVLLNRPDSRAVRLSPQGALLWGVAHGRPREVAVRLASELLGVSQTDVDDYYAVLLQLGVGG